MASNSLKNVSFDSTPEQCPIHFKNLAQRNPILFTPGSTDKFRQPNLLKRNRCNLHTHPRNDSNPRNTIAEDNTHTRTQVYEDRREREGGRGRENYLEIAASGFLWVRKFYSCGGGGENSHLACHTQAWKGNIGGERGNVSRMKASRFPKRNNSRQRFSKFPKNLFASSFL